MQTRGHKIGDNLIAGSVLAPLKRQGYMTEVISSEPFGVVFQHNPYIDKLTLKNVERDLPQGDMAAWQNWMRSRSNEYDVFVHASHSVEVRHAFFPTDTKFWWPEDYRRKVGAGSYLETAHDIAGVPYEFGPLYFSSEEEKEQARNAKNKIGDKVIAWIISGTRIDKMYPYAPSAIARIIKEMNVPVVVMGGPSDKELAAAQAAKEFITAHNGSSDGLYLALPDGAHLGGDRCWPIRTSLSYLQQCDMIIAPDTGPSWAVAMEPMPKVIMVSHASAENITKHWVNTTTLHADQNRVPCWPCHRLHDTPATCVENKEKNGAACISDISVEHLLNTIKQQWSKWRYNVVHAEHAFSGGISGEIVNMEGLPIKATL